MPEGPRIIRRMHQTTVRFGPELWSMLEREAERSGVSVAHYVREAALARVAYAAGRGSASGGGSELAWADERNIASLDSAVKGRIEDSAVQAQADLARESAQRLRRDAKSARRSRART